MTAKSAIGPKGLKHTVIILKRLAEGTQCT